jgi:GTP-sensing pleiotropic transcriptional regulator CodY
MVSTENMDEQEWRIIDGKLCKRIGIDKKVIVDGILELGSGSCVNVVGSGVGGLHVV